jgi:hypothetical protein
MNRKHKELVRERKREKEGRAKEKKGKRNK